MGMTTAPEEPEVAGLKGAVEEVRREASARSRLRAKLATGVLLAVAALLVAAAFAVAAPLTVATAVSYERTPEAAVATITIVVTGAPNTTYGVEVRGPANEIVAVREVETNATGVALLKLELPEIYPAGTYTVYVAGGGESAVATFTVSWNVTAPAAPAAPAAPGVRVAAENLIRVAVKLGTMVHCRNEVLLAANVTRTELNATFQAVLNLTKAGDGYLAQANASLAAGNYTAAMRYAQLAIRSYGRALELQEDIREQLGVSFAACRVTIAPPREIPAPARNATCRWTPEFYPLMTAFNVTERRVEELRRLLARLEERGYNVTGLAMMLDEAEKLVEEGRQLALACNVSEAAHKLAQANKYIGAVNAAIAKLGGMRFVKELERRFGIEIGKEEVEKAMRRGKLPEKLAEKVNETLRKLAVTEGLSEKELRDVGKRVGNLEKLIEKLKKEERVPRIAEEISRKVEEIRKSIEREIARRAQEARGRGGKP